LTCENLRAKLGWRFIASAAPLVDLVEATGGRIAVVEDPAGFDRRSLIGVVTIDGTRLAAIWHTRFEVALGPPLTCSALEEIAVVFVGNPFGAAAKNP